MKKLCWIPIAAVLLFASCSETVKIPEVIAAVDNDAVVTYDGTAYECHITYVNDRVAGVELHSPDSLKGLTFRRTENGQTVSLGKLLCRSEQFPFGSDCVAEQVFQALDGVKQERIKWLSVSDGQHRFTGKNESSLTFLTDSDGQIRQLSDGKLTIRFQESGK